MLQRNLNYFLGIVVIILLGLVGFLSLKNKSEAPTAEVSEQNTNQAQEESPLPEATGLENNPQWATYKNEQFGFQFSYPKGYDYTVKEECNVYFNIPSCLVTLKNGYSTLLVETNSPGHGWFGTRPNPQTGILDIGGVQAKYKYGPAENEGGELPETWVLLTDFKKGTDTYNIAYLYQEAHPGVFMDQIMIPVLQSIKFTK